MIKVAAVLLREGVRVSPKKIRVVIRARPDLDDTTRMLVAELAKRKISTVVLTAGHVRRPTWMPREVRLLRVRSLQAFATYMTSSHVFFTHGLFGSVRPPSNQIVVNVWHGMPLKSIGADIGHSEYRRFTVTIATSERFREIVARSFDVVPSAVLLAELPRNEMLTRTASTRPVQGRYVVWLPTWRSAVLKSTLHVDGDPQTGVPDSDELTSLVAELAAQGVTLVAKIHPFSDPSESDRFRNAGAMVLDETWLADNETTLYEVLSASSALMTDYSSVAVDYLVTGRPIIFVHRDLDAYRQSRGLNFTNEELALLGSTVLEGPGFVEDVLRILDAAAPSSEEARELFHSVEGSGATSRLLDLLSL